MAGYELKSVDPTSAETALKALDNAANFQRNAFDTGSNLLGAAQNFVAENQYKDINNKMAQLNPQDRPKALQQLLASGQYGALNSTQLHQLGYEDQLQNYGIMSADTAANRAMKELTTDIDFAEDFAAARKAYDSGNFNEYAKIQQQIAQKYADGRGRYIHRDFAPGDPNKWKLGYAELEAKKRIAAMQAAAATAAYNRPVETNLANLDEGINAYLRRQYGTTTNLLSEDKINKAILAVTGIDPNSSNGYILRNRLAKNWGWNFADNPLDFPINNDLFNNQQGNTTGQGLADATRDSVVPLNSTFSKQSLNNTLENNTGSGWSESSSSILRLYQ